MNIRSTPRRSLLAALSVLLVAGCGEAKTIAVGGGPAIDSYVAPKDTSAPQPDVSQPDEGPVAGTQRMIILKHSATDPPVLVVGEVLLVEAMVIDFASGKEAEGVLVSYAIVSREPEDGDAIMTASYAYTDVEGWVGSTFKSNTVPDVDYVVRLAAEGAQPVELPIVVTDIPKGKIRVKIEWQGPINVKNIDVRLCPGTFSCSQFKPTNVPTCEGKTVLGGLGLNPEVSWDDLPSDQSYTVVATAQSPSESLAAKGCIDLIKPDPSGSNVHNMVLTLLVLNPMGSYDTVSFFNFTGAIPGQAGEIVDEIVKLFTNPGGFLIDMIKLVVSQWVPAWVTDAAFGLFEDQLGQIVTDWIFNNAPDWLQDIFIIGEDLIQVVHHLNLLATLNLSKLQNDYWMQGDLEWQGIVLWWHYGCPKEDEPDYDPDCGKFEVSMSTLGIEGIFPPDIIAGKFQAEIHQFDMFDVYQHVIKLNYGKLIVFVLEKVLLKAITGYDNMEEALYSFVNCAGIASFFSNVVLDAVGLTEEKLEQGCHGAIDFLVGPVMTLIGNLSLSSQLSLSGSALLVDVDQNLIVDDIVDGVWAGNIQINGEQGAEFSGTWDAHRKQ